VGREGVEAEDDMNCVVLLGFSTTGKSSILREFCEQFGDAIEPLDSDEWLARNHDRHVYNLYLSLRDGKSTARAIKEIADQEREFLRITNPGTKPMLLAAAVHPEPNAGVGHLSCTCEASLFLLGEGTRVRALWIAGTALSASSDSALGRRRRIWLLGPRLHDRSTRR
jgi:hypothetical protein